VRVPPLGVPGGPHPRLERWDRLPQPVLVPEDQREGEVFPDVVVVRVAFAAPPLAGGRRAGTEMSAPGVGGTEHQRPARQLPR
jgi:hypothetical protein